MRLFLWFLVTCLGLVCMIGAFRADEPAKEAGPYASGLIYVSKAGSLPNEANAKKPGEKIPQIPFPTKIARMRLLPLSGMGAKIAVGTATGDAERERDFKLQFAERLLEISPEKAGLTDADFAWGRLPRPGAPEVIAGNPAMQSREIHVDGESFTIVGGLRRGAALFDRSYLVPPDPALNTMFDTAADDVRTAFLVSLRPDQLRDLKTFGQLEASLPHDRFDVIRPVLVMQRGPFLGYLLGQALFCLGGTGVLIGLYTILARRVRWPLLQEPLSALVTHRRLLGSVHVVYFGLYFLAAVAAYQLPDVQHVLLNTVQKQIHSGSGPLGVAGTAYASQNVLRAAAVTFGVNFFLGSLAYLTLPSCVIPGISAPLAAFRAMLWGLLLGPTSRDLAGAMLPHSGTLLLEGEGYILATFFGLLIPVYLFRSSLGPSVAKRYVTAVLLNLKGNVVVAVVLILAALYESVEVIQMMKLSVAP
jgi:hypothetical protein